LGGVALGGVALGEVALGEVALGEVALGEVRETSEGYESDETRVKMIGMKRRTPSLNSG